MDPVRFINRVTVQGAQNLHAYETHIAENMRNSDSMDELESKFMSQCAQAKTMIEGKANQIVNAVIPYYPNSWDSNYWQKRQYYEVLAEYACAHINHMDDLFDGTFSRLKNLFQRLSTWIRNRVTQVYTAVKGFFRGAVNRIRGWFS